MILDPQTIKQDERPWPDNGPKYILLPVGGCVAMNAKAGTTSICRRLLEMKGKEGMRGDRQRRVEWTHVPVAPLSLLVRDPVSRFASACLQIGQHDPEKVMDSLEAFDDLPGTKGRRMFEVDGRRVSDRCANSNHHLQTQACHILSEALCFRFPDHFDLFAKAAGLGPLPRENDSRQKRPALAETLRERCRETELLARITKWYAVDVALFDLVTTPGVVVEMVDGWPKTKDTT